MYGRIPDKIVERLKHPLVVAAAAQLGVKVAQEVYRLRAGEMTFEQFKDKVGRHVGGLTGTATGAVAGAWLGSFVPGVGTVVGAFGGGLAGDLLGEYATRRGTTSLRPEASEREAPAPGTSDIQGTPENVDSSRNGSEEEEEDGSDVEEDTEV